MLDSGEMELVLKPDSKVHGPSGANGRFWREADIR
jgi:hypothetical protein